MQFDGRDGEDPFGFKDRLLWFEADFVKGSIFGTVRRISTYYTPFNSLLISISFLLPIYMLLISLDGFAIILLLMHETY